MAGAGRRGETAVLAIGQGSILATPLQLAVLAGRIATGRQLRPRTVRPALAQRPPRAASPPLRGPAFAPLSGVPYGHLELVRKALDAAVNEPGGTAYRRRITGRGDGDGGQDRHQPGAPHQPCRARSRRHQERRPSPGGGATHALFIGYAPLARPALRRRRCRGARRRGARRSPLPSCATFSSTPSATSVWRGSAGPAQGGRG